jgi:hypothetical protein
VSELPKRVAIPKRAKGREKEIITKLNAWAKEPADPKGKPTHVYPNWIAAVGAAITALDTTPASTTATAPALTTATAIAPPATKVYTRETYTVTGDVTFQTDTGTSQNIWFTADGCSAIPPGRP